MIRPPAPEEDDDDEDYSHAAELVPRDSTLMHFLRRPPLAADHWVLVAFTPHGESVLDDRTVAEVRGDAEGLADAAIDAAEAWARTEARQVRFRSTWLDGERVLATYQWTCGTGGDAAALDGTTAAFLRQQQQHAEADHKLYHEGFAMVQEGWKTLVLGSNAQVVALQKDNAELRERLRKAGDVDTEIAMAQAASELESRARLADMLETRVLPIVQTIAVKYMEKISLMPDPTPSPPAAAIASARSATVDSYAAEREARERES